MRSLTEATLIEPRSGPEAEERAYEEAMIEGEPDEAGPQEPQPHLERPEEGADLAAEERARDVSADFDMARTIETPSAADWNEPTDAEARQRRIQPLPGRRRDRAATPQPN